MHYSAGAASSAGGASAGAASAAGAGAGSAAPALGIMSSMDSPFSSAFSMAMIL